MSDGLSAILAFALAAVFVAMIAWQWRSRDLVDPVLSMIAEDETFKPVTLWLTIILFGGFAVLSVLIGFSFLGIG